MIYVPPLRLYLAGASSEHDRFRNFNHKVNLIGGMASTHNWWEDPEIGVKGRSVEENLRKASADFEGVYRSHLTILLAPNPGHKSQGCWVELGYALGLQRARAVIQSVPHLWVVGEPPEDRFFSLQANKHFDSEADCLDALRTVKAQKSLLV